LLELTLSALQATKMGCGWLYSGILAVFAAFRHGPWENTREISNCLGRSVHGGPSLPVERTNFSLAVI
jgi:hypothetical protein